MSEHLSQNAVNFLSKFFRCEVVSRYSNMENGFIAQQLSGNSKYFLNQGSYFVEILKEESDEEAQEGEVGRIVVTDLFNDAMPLIRYDTGDLAKKEKDNWSGDVLEVLSGIEGRKVDSVFSSDGRLISPHTVTNTMWKFNEVVQFQFVQKTQNEYLLKLNIKEPFKREDELTSEIKDYFGSDISVYFEYVSEIPVLSSGKRKKIVNEYRKS